MKSSEFTKVGALRELKRVGWYTENMWLSNGKLLANIVRENCDTFAENCRINLNNRVCGNVDFRLNTNKLKAQYGTPQNLETILLKNAIESKMFSTNWSYVETSFLKSEFNFVK